MAVFFTAAVISGILRMKYSPLVVWNFVAGAVYVPPRSGLPPTARARSRPAGRGQPEHALVAGLAIAARCAVLAARYYRRRRARRLLAGAELARPAGNHADTA